MKSPSSSETPEPKERWIRVLGFRVSAHVLVETTTLYINANPTLLHRSWSNCKGSKLGPKLRVCYFSGRSYHLADSCKASGFLSFKDYMWVRTDDSVKSESKPAKKDTVSGPVIANTNRQTGVMGLSGEKKKKTGSIDYKQRPDPQAGSSGASRC